MAYVYDVEGGRWVDDPVPSPYSKLSGDDPAIQWANSMITGPSNWSPPDDVSPGGFANPGVNPDRVLLGQFGQVGSQENKFIEDTLKNVAAAAGKPDFDWTLAKAKAAQQHYQQNPANGGYRLFDSSWGNVLQGIIQNSGDPAISTVWQQHAPEVMGQAQSAWDSWKTAEEAGDKRRHRNRFIAMAAPLAAWGGAALAGAGAGSGAAGGGLSAELAAGAPELTGTMGLSSGTGAGALSAELAAGAPAAATAPAAAGGAAAGGGAGALQRVLNGTATTADYLQLAGTIGSTGLGMYASNKQTGAAEDLANKYFGMGAPYRQTLADITADPNKFYESPQAQLATDAVLRRLSAGGNPAANPYMQAQTINALFGQYGQERDRLAGYGGLTAYNQAAPGAASNAIGMQSNFYNALGSGLEKLTSPPQRKLSDILRDVVI